MSNSITKKYGLMVADTLATKIAIKFGEWLASSPRCFEPYFNQKPGMWIDYENKEYTTNELLNEFIEKHYKA